MAIKLVDIDNNIVLDVDPVIEEEVLDDVHHVPALSAVTDYMTKNKSDWNVNDENSTSYIKNRPFYSVGESSTVVINTSDLEPLSTTPYECDSSFYQEGITVTMTGEYIDTMTFVSGEKDTDGYIWFNEAEDYPSFYDRFYCSYDGTNYYLNYIKEDDNGKVTITYGNEEITQLDEKYIPNRIARIDNLYDTIGMKDAVTGATYLVQMQNGRLVSFSKCIDIDARINKYLWYEGETLDKSDFIVTAVCEDGTEREVKNYTISTNQSDVLVAGDLDITISYTELGVTYTDSITITVEALDLSDFTYTTNDDGTYTLTGWNETLDDEASTECVVPDIALIKL